MFLGEILALGCVDCAEGRFRRGIGGGVFVFGWSYFDGEPPLKRGLNDLDGCIGQPGMIIRGGFFGV